MSEVGIGDIDIFMGGLVGSGVGFLVGVGDNSFVGVRIVGVGDIGSKLGEGISKFKVVDGIGVSVAGAGEVTAVVGRGVEVAGFASLDGASVEVTTGEVFASGIVVGVMEAS